MHGGVEAATDLGQEAAREFNRRDQRTIHATVSPLRQSAHSRWTLLRHHPRQADGIGADVHQGATGQRGIQADVRSVFQGETEARLYELHATHRTRV